MVNQNQLNGKKVELEYELNSTSLTMIWDAISTAPGLESWFADSVKISNKTYSFTWGKNESRDADLINCRQFTYVRFHWLDSLPGTYFEIRITRNELTQTYALEIIDFADGTELDDVRSIWNSAIEELHRKGL
ncbi:MAG: START-like domain-containing protein [Bacteroidaceae bacterium]|nr:START-like domain-containing protein [Bacteroidaceae bacterium]